MKVTLESIRVSLLDQADEATRETARRFFKEEVKTHGVKSAAVTKIAKAATKDMKGASKAEVFALCDKLLESRYLEEGGVACALVYDRAAEFEPEDLAVFEGWLERHVSNWASCDTLCNHSVGTLLEMYPERIERVKGWAASANRWKRRGAAVSLIIPARKGMFLDEIFEIADTLLRDGDDLVQKGYGWMLKATSEANLEEVFSYVMSKREVMPRTAFRYALEKMPPEMRKQAMAG